MQKTKLGGRFWLALTVFSLVGQVAWVVENMYFNVFIYKMFHATAAQISLMVAASAVVATLTTILIGALSDRVGKRKMFICVGYLLWGISILSFALIRVDVISPMVSAGVAVTTVCVNLTILMDCVMTFFGSTANDACFNAWLTDSTDDTNRGAAEGINAMMPMMAILVVFGGFMFFDLEKAASWVTIFTIIGVVVILIGIVGFWLIREPKVTPSPAGSYWGSILYGFRPSVIRRHKVLYLTLLAFAGFGISIQVFMPYLILYYEKSLGMTNYVLVMAPAIVLAAVFTAFYGRRYDTHGFRRSILPGIALLMAGYLALYFTRDTLPVFFRLPLLDDGLPFQQCHLWRHDAYLHPAGAGRPVPGPAHCGTGAGAGGHRPCHRRRGAEECRACGQWRWHHLLPPQCEYLAGGLCGRGGAVRPAGTALCPPKERRSHPENRLKNKPSAGFVSGRFFDLAALLIILHSINPPIR